LTDTLAFRRLLWALDHSLRSTSKQIPDRLVTGRQCMVSSAVGRASGTMPSQLADLLHSIRKRAHGDRRASRVPAASCFGSDTCKTEVSSRASAEDRELDHGMIGTLEECIWRASSTAATQLDAAKRGSKPSLLSWRRRRPNAEAMSCARASRPWRVASARRDRPSTSWITAHVLWLAPLQIWVRFVPVG
jgi:hypothetical protein